MQKTDIELDPEEEEILDMLILKTSGLYIKRIDEEEDAPNDDNKAESAWEMDDKKTGVGCTRSSILDCRLNKCL